MENNKEHRLIFRVTDEEYRIIKRKCELSHSKNMSAFIRRMVLCGLGVTFPEELLQKFYRTVGGAANNLNQIAMRYNSSNRIYNEDINELKASAAEIQKQIRALQNQISKIHFCKTLGWYYETSQIKMRIENFKRRKDFSLDSKPKTKIIDTAADKFQQAKGLERWADIQNMKEASRMIDMLTKYGITGVDEVAPAAISTSMHRAKLVEALNGLQREITGVSETLEALRVFQKQKPFMLKLKELPDRKKKSFAEKYSREIEKYKSAGAKLKEKYPDGKVPSEEILTEKRNALIEQRNKSNTEYKEVKSKLKGVDYARQAIDDYLRNQRDIQQKKRKKDDLE